MIIDVFVETLERELYKLAWFPVIVFFIRLFLFIFIVVTIIEVVHSINQTKKYTVKIYNLLANSSLNQNKDMDDE